VVAGVVLFFLAYTYLGYPLLLSLLARLGSRRPESDASWEPTVSICVAAYNCEAYIHAKLRSLAALDYPADKMEILVYSDASTDGTDADWAQPDT
jgi:biofilm PGA synthesis N-glycosyltransferase PgaC